MDYDKKYPEKEFAKKTYSFTPGELRELGSLDTIVKMGQLAQVMVSQMVAGKPLKRVGIKDSPDVGILYDLEKAEFYVFEPKFWCSACHNKMAKFTWENKNYCPTCLEVLKEQANKEKTKNIKPKK